eukprot:scaffold40098_cov36-Cyclotella_meneghiniana.AAC.4
MATAFFVYRQATGQATNSQPAPVAIDTERGASFALHATSAISKPSARSSHHHCYVILPMS